MVLGDHGTTSIQFDGGPLEGQHHDDVPTALYGSPPWLLFVPLPATVTTASETAVYERDAFDSAPWLYSFVHMITTGPPPAGSFVPPATLPAGTRATFLPEIEMAMDAFAFQPSRRSIAAEAWWIGSELCRRHDDLQLLDTPEGGGQYETLSVRPARRTAAGTHIAHVDLNRSGRIHTHEPGFEPITWAEALSADSPHTIVKRIEAAKGWGSAGGADATTPRSLTYRTISAVLRSRVHDRAEWNVRMGYDLEWVGSDAALEQFPTASSALAHAAGRTHLMLPLEHFWLVTADAEPVVLFDDEGTAHHLNSATIDLMAVYRRRHRIPDVVGAIEAELP